MEMSKDKDRIENIFSSGLEVSEGNPFGSKSDISAENSPTSLAPKRINGYDSTILNKINTPENNSQELSLNYRIKEKESVIKDLESQIKNAETYGTQNETLGLKAKKQRVQQELDTLKRQELYAERVLGDSPKFSHERFKKNMPVIYKIQKFISRNILARLSKKVKSVITLTDSLEKLAEINNSVNQLVAMNVPYGEKVQNYERLTNYLYQANIIHSKISQTMGKKA